MGRSDASERWRSRESESARAGEKLPYEVDRQMMQWLNRRRCYLSGELETRDDSCFARLVVLLEYSIILWRFIVLRTRGSTAKSAISRYLNLTPFILIASEILCQLIQAIPITGNPRDKLIELKARVIPSWGKRVGCSVNPGTRSELGVSFLFP
jgi:hypothetical protein